MSEMEPPKGARLDASKSADHVPLELPSSGDENNIGATSKEYEEQQSYLQGIRLHLVMVAYVI